MLVPSWVQATCTAVNEATSLPDASLTTSTALACFESPTCSKSLARSILKLTLPGGAAAPTLFPFEQAARQPAHTAATDTPMVEIKSLRCMGFKLTDDS